MTEARKAELRALCNAATVAPWYLVGKMVTNPAGDAERGNWKVADVVWPEDAQFIVVARTALPEALDRIAELDAMVARLKNPVTEKLSEMDVKLDAIARAVEAPL